MRRSRRSTGFLKKTGLTREQLEERDGVLFAHDRPAGARGRARCWPRRSRQIVRDFPWPKSMRWGDRGKSALGAAAARHRRLARRGHRAGRGRRHRGRRGDGRPPLPPSRARSPSAARDDYVEKLRACHVIVDQEEREAIDPRRRGEAAEGRRPEPWSRTRGWWSRMPG